MRYAVYITTADDPVCYSFSASYPTKEMALEKVAEIKAMTLTVKGIIIEVSYPDQRIDPYAHHFWPTTTVSEVMKAQRAKLRKEKETATK